MSLMIVMEPMDELPLQRTSTMTQEAADQIWRHASERQGKFLAARDTKRSHLERINRVLRARGKVVTVVRCTEKDDQGNPVEYCLFVEWDDNEPPREPRRRRSNRSAE